METIRTHYEDLEVREDASPEVIRGAYRYLTQKWHPDKNPERREEAERNSIAINEAYAVLSDPELRREYDARIATQRKANADPQAPSAPPPPKSPTPRTAQTSEPARLSRRQIWLWIAGIVFLRVAATFAVAAIYGPAIFQERTGQTPLHAILGAIVGTPALLGLVYVVAWCITKPTAKRMPRAKGVLIASTAFMFIWAFQELGKAQAATAPSMTTAGQSTLDAPTAVTVPPSAARLSLDEIFAQEHANAASSTNGAAPPTPESTETPIDDPWDKPISSLTPAEWNRINSEWQRINPSIAASPMATAAMNEAYQSVYRTMSTRPTREVIEAAQNLAVQNGWTTQAQRVATTTAAAAANNPRPSARVHPASVERERPHCPAGTGATLEDGQCCTHPQSIEHADGSVTILQAQCFPPSQ